VPSVGPVGFPLKPGIFVFVAGEPSATTRAVADALTAAGLTPAVNTGYAEYSDARRREDPTWKGISFAPGQDFVIVVGRRAAN
jgi:hypothetical protein